jgi:hypothetical protein
VLHLQNCYQEGTCGGAGFTLFFNKSSEHACWVSSASELAEMKSAHYFPWVCFALITPLCRKVNM